MKILILIMTALILCISTLAYSAEGERRVDVVDVSDDIQLHRIYKEGILREVISFSRKTWKPHGERRLYDKDGEMIKSEWFVRGEWADEEAFWAAQRKPEIEIQFSLSEKEEGDRINRFVKDLSIAWVRRDYKYCKKLIEDSLAKNPNWVPGHLANFGYLLSVELNFEGALMALKKAWDLIEREPKVNIENNTKAQRAQRILAHIIPGTIRMMERKIKKGTIADSRLALDNVFPGTEFSILYGSSRGYRVSPLRDLIVQENQ